MKKWVAVWAVVALSLGLAMPGFAADKEKKIVLQISDAGDDKQTLVLNVANNLQNHYGIDNVKLEIVAFGPGLQLLFKDNVNKGRIDALAKSGVRFSACENTSKSMAKALGYPPKLNAQAVVVTAGISRIVELTEQGYTLVRP